MYPISMFIITTILMFVFGLIALILKRDLVRLLIGIEILFNASNLFLVALSTQASGMVDPFPQSIVMMALVLDGTVIAVGLALALNVFKHYKTFDIKKLRKDLSRIRYEISHDKVLLLLYINISNIVEKKIGDQEDPIWIVDRIKLYEGGKVYINACRKSGMEELIKPLNYTYYKFINDTYYSLMISYALHAEEKFESSALVQ